MAEKKWSKEVQRRYVDDYLREQENVERAAWCVMMGIPLRTFGRWLGEQTVVTSIRRVAENEAGATGRKAAFEPAPRGWRVRREDYPERLGEVELGGKREADLTERDLQILEDLRHDRCNTLGLVAQRHFGSGTNPRGAAERRLQALRAAGWV